MTIHLKAKVEAGGKLVTTDEKRFPLRGKGPYRYDDPFSPAVPPEEWDAAWVQPGCARPPNKPGQFLQNLSTSPAVPPIAGDEIGS